MSVVILASLLISGSFAAIARELMSAPEAYEDDRGFHVTADGLSLS